MSLFECRTCKVLLPLTRDLQEQLATREREWQAERKDLLDRLLAATRPDALQTLRREPRPAQQRQRDDAEPDRPEVTPPPKSLLPKRGLASNDPEQTARELLVDPVTLFSPKAS